MFAPRRILVPTDFTNDSDRALREAIEIAAASHGRVYMLHVDPSVLAVGETVVNPEVVNAVEENDKLITRRKMLEEARKVASQTEVEIEFDERHGVTFEKILEYMRDKLDRSRRYRASHKERFAEKPAWRCHGQAAQGSHVPDARATRHGLTPSL